MGKSVRTLNVLVEAKTQGYMRSILNAIRRSKEFKQAVGGMKKTVSGVAQILKGTGQAAVAAGMALFRLKGSSDLMSAAQKNMAEGGKKVSMGLKTIGTAALAAAKHMLKAAWASVKANLSFHGLAKNVRKGSHSLRSLVRLTKINVAIQLMETLSYKVKEVASYYANLADSIQATQEAAQRAGMGTKKYSGLQFAASMSGVTSQVFQQNMDMMMQHIGMLASGARTTGIHLRLFGLNAMRLASMNAGHAMEAIAAAMHRVHDAAQRAALSQAFFGRSSQKMINFLMEGNREIRRQVKLADNLGVAFNSVQAKRVEQANDAILEMGAAWRGVQQQLIIGLAPAVEAVGKWFLKVTHNGKVMGEVVNVALLVAAGTFGMLVDVMQDGKILVVACWHAIEGAVLGVVASIITAMQVARHFYYGVGEWIVSKATGVSIKAMNAEKSHPGGGKWWKKLQEEKKAIKKGSAAEENKARQGLQNLLKHPFKNMHDYLNKMEAILSVANNAAPHKNHSINSVLTLPEHAKKIARHAHHAHHAHLTNRDPALSIMSRAQIQTMDPAERRAIAQRDVMIELLSRLENRFAVLPALGEASL